jgi:hypothetical protein
MTRMKEDARIMKQAALALGSRRSSCSRQGRTRVRFLVIILLSACSICAACSRTKVDFFAQDTNTRTHEPYCVFDVGDYNRGLFWGPCAFSTYSARWLYQVTLDGAGPAFSAGDISLLDELGEASEEFRPMGGQVFLDRNKMTVTIALQVSSSSGAKDFVGNGAFHIEKGP